MSRAAGRRHRRRRRSAVRHRPRRLLGRACSSPQPEGERRVHDFDPGPYFDNPKEARRADRFTQFALAAAAEALEQAGEIGADPARRGVIVGTGVGGLATLEEQILDLHDKGARRVSPFLVPMMMSNAGAAVDLDALRLAGPVRDHVTACAAGTQCVGNARPAHRATAGATPSSAGSAARRP